MKKIDRVARFKGKPLNVWAEDDTHYYIWWEGKVIEGVIDVSVCVVAHRVLDIRA